MKARNLIESAIAQNPNVPLIDVLHQHPDLLAQIKQAEGGIYWQPGSRDGWYYTEDRDRMIDPDDSVKCLIYWQERGGACWGETFTSFAEAVAWAYKRGLL